jgi:hypothetical protein
VRQDLRQQLIKPSKLPFTQLFTGELAIC